MLFFHVLGDIFLQFKSVCHSHSHSFASKRNILLSCFLNYHIHEFAFASAFRNWRGTLHCDNFLSVWMNMRYSSLLIDGLIDVRLNWLIDWFFNGWGVNMLINESSSMWGFYARISCLSSRDGITIHDENDLSRVVAHSTAWSSLAPPSTGSLSRVCYLWVWSWAKLSCPMCA